MTQCCLTQLIGGAGVGEDEDLEDTNRQHAHEPEENSSGFYTSLNDLNNTQRDMTLNCDENAKKNKLRFNLIVANARSLVKKMESLIFTFEEYETSVALLSETWFRTGRRYNNEMMDMELGQDIKFIAKNRAGRGGGVAIAFNKNVIDLKEYKLPGNIFEMVCGVGNSTAGNRKMAFISLYIPPRQRAGTTAKLRGVLSDGINKLKSSFDNPIIFVGGDTNNRKLEGLLSEFHDIVTVNAPPTRGSAKLDEISTNVIEYIDSTTSIPPLETEGGIRSDHMMLLIGVEIPSVHRFTKNTFEYRPITENGKKKFLEMVST